MTWQREYKCNPNFFYQKEIKHAYAGSTFELRILLSTGPARPFILRPPRLLFSRSPGPVSHASRFSPCPSREFCDDYATAGASASAAVRQVSGSPSSGWSPSPATSSHQVRPPYLFRSCCAEPSTQTLTIGNRIWSDPISVASPDGGTSEARGDGGS